MAVAGMHNVSVLESSYLGDNYSPVWKRWGNQERSTAPTSSIQKMWREHDGRQQTTSVLNGNTESTCPCLSQGGHAESEVVSMGANEIENESPQNQNQNQTGPQISQDNHDSSVQHSPAFGVAEKERVRQIFREWGSKSFGGRTSLVSRMKNCSRAQQIGENGRTSIGFQSLEKQATEFGCQIEQVRDGLVVNHIRVGARRPIRRLYGRQALLDLLTKFERERKRELQILLEKRLVSNCAHRNRIQSLLKGRFLRSQNFVQDEKPTSIAATELGLLRQTHTVSDLRKGFLSRLENYENALDGAQSDTSSNNNMEYQGNEQNETVDALKINEQVLEIEEKEQLSTTTDFIEPRSQDQEGSVERTQDIHHIELFRDSMGTRCITQAPSLKVDEIMHAQSEGEEQEVQEISIHLDPFETSTDSLFWQEGASQVEEWQGLLTEDEEGEWLTNIDSDEGLDVNSSGDQHQWHQETSVIDSQESHEEWSNNILHEAAPVNVTETFYSSDDDNGKRLELKNLMSRRRVSNLLQSDFRVRLEHLIQSYLERHDLGSESDDEWRLEREEQDWEQQSVNEIDSTEGAAPSLPDFSQSHSDNVLQDVVDWQYPNINQHFGTEWEIINGLRIDMATLQERVNNMEKMLESCMDMQLELQRVVHQEVSSALNRSSNSAESCEGGLQINEAKWGPGMEGFCFLCSDNNTDSLADRFTHVYVCSKCAEKINWSKLKESVRQPR